MQELLVLIENVRDMFLQFGKEADGAAGLLHMFTLPLNIEAQITGLYYSKRNIPQGEELARSSVDLGLKKSLWNKKGEITLSVSDLFNNFGLRQRIKGEGFSALYENYYETQIVRLGMKYKF